MIDQNKGRLKIALVRETKQPTDNRVPLTPKQCASVMAKSGHLVQIVVQRSKIRCFRDEEFAAVGIPLVDSVTDAHVLLGVKEVAMDSLVSNATYIMFSHTIKKQEYNRRLLQTILKEHIRLLDWECMKNERGFRVIAFGRWAGIVGAHNALYTWGKKTGRFDLFRLLEVQDWEAAKERYTGDLKPAALRGLRIVLTGDGRVSSGCCEVLDTMGIKKIAPEDFLKLEGDNEAFYTQLPADRLYRLGKDETFSETFFQDPRGYHSVLAPFLTKGNVLINGIYWDKRCAPLFTDETMQEEDFGIKVIADITCDIAPDSSIPSTLRPSTIGDPVYGYDPELGSEVPPYSENSVDVMAIDQLPNELPRDASTDFGDMFLRCVLPEFLKPRGTSRLIDEATIANDGKLTEHYEYLTDFATTSVEE